MVDKRLLQGMQHAVRREPFDGSDLGAILHHGERQAGIDAPPVYQHRARAALTVVAALLGAGKVEMIPQQVQQSDPRSNFGSGFDAVDGHPHGNLPG